MFLLFWLALAVVMAVLARKLTHSSGAAFVGFLLILGNRMAFTITWLQRYELLGGAIACIWSMALIRAGPRDGLARLDDGTCFFRAAVDAPGFSGLAGAGWCVY